MCSRSQRPLPEVAGQSQTTYPEDAEEAGAAVKRLATRCTSRNTREKKKAKEQEELINITIKNVNIIQNMGKRE